MQISTGIVSINANPTSSHKVWPHDTSARADKGSSHSPHYSTPSVKGPLLTSMNRSIDRFIETYTSIDALLPNQMGTEVAGIDIYV